MSKFNLNAIKASLPPPIQKGDTVKFEKPWVSATGVRIRKGALKVVHWIGHHTFGKRTYTVVKVKEGTTICIVAASLVKKVSSTN